MKKFLYLVIFTLNFFLFADFVFTGEKEKRSLPFFDLLRDLSSEIQEKKEKGLARLGYPAERLDVLAAFMNTFYYVSPCCVKINGYHPILLNLSFGGPNDGDLFLSDIHGELIQGSKSNKFPAMYVKGISLLNLLGDGNEQILIEEDNGGNSSAWTNYYYIFRVTPQGLVIIWDEIRLMHNPLTDVKTQIYFEEFPGEMAKRIIYETEEIEYESDFAWDKIQQKNNLKKIYRFNETIGQYELLK